MMPSPESIGTARSCIVLAMIELRIGGNEQRIADLLAEAYREFGGEEAKYRVPCEAGKVPA